MVKWISQSMKMIPDPWMDLICGTNTLERLLNETLINVNNDIGGNDSLLSPEPSDIFRFTQYCTPDKIRVVIIGQNPQKNPVYENGLCFSTTAIDTPDTLKNIYDCLIEQKFMEEYPKTNDLISWALQGVLLINSAWTTSKTSNHANLWKSYFEEFIKLLCKYSNNNLMFLLWGKIAQEFEPLIDTSRHMCLKYTHPYYESFKTCPHFRIVNEIFTDQPINWNPDLKYDMLIEVATDGSAHPNRCTPDAVAGAGIYFNMSPSEFKLSGVEILKNIQSNPPKYYGTNIRGEGEAINTALSIVQSVISKNNHHRYHIRIITDSEYWIDVFNNYIYIWLDKKCVEQKKNGDLASEIWKRMKYLNKRNVSIEFYHVPGHDKRGWSKYPLESIQYQYYELNEKVDKLANEARSELKSNETIMYEST